MAGHGGQRVSGQELGKSGNKVGVKFLYRGFHGLGIVGHRNFLSSVQAGV
jgi:hypothetical protein